ncbi:MAG: hypothetical protein IJD54_00405 [Clostridia bacterium]|nr:hypothetical protein [Clostridia bacterium]
MYLKSCPFCGTRLDEFYATSMLGCPNCYKAFEMEIKLALKKIQGRDFHVGKTPSGVAIDKELLNEYKKLLSDKELAVINGDFAKVNSLSAEIFKLKKELKDRGLI